MGSIWLRDLPAWFAADGIPYRTFLGWETRARSSGGFDQVWGIIAHHTGGVATWQQDCAYQWVNASTRPIGNVHLDRGGVWTLGAAGATNTAGRGIAEWHTSKGVIPLSPTSMGNRMTFNVEAANSGVGERWPKVQVDSYLRGMNMLCRRLGLDPTRDVTTHRGWAGTRKSDPFGPAEGYATLGTQSWPVPTLRALVAAAGPTPPPPTPKPPPTKSVTTGVLDMIPVLRRSDGAVFYTLDGGRTRHSVSTPEQWEAVEASGAVDLRTKAKITDAGQITTLSDAEIQKYMGPSV